MSSNTRRRDGVEQFESKGSSKMSGERKKDLGAREANKDEIDERKAEPKICVVLMACGKGRAALGGKVHPGYFDIRSHHHQQNSKKLWEDAFERVSRL